MQENSGYVGDDLFDILEDRRTLLILLFFANCY